MGDRQGAIKGSVMQPGREESILVLATAHDIILPRDAASGRPTGKRQHRPFIITKEVDRSSPLLYAMLADNENIRSWRLEFWRPSRSGQEVQHYTIDLKNAFVAGIRHEMLPAAAGESPHGDREHISFCYESIRWTWVDGEITAQDDWQAPIV